MKRRLLCVLATCSLAPSRRGRFPRQAGEDRGRVGAGQLDRYRWPASSPSSFPGNGTTTHLGAEWLFKALAKVDITHSAVPAGGGDDSLRFPRNPRLAFEQACTLL